MDLGQAQRIADQLLGQRALVAMLIGKADELKAGAELEKQVRDARKGAAPPDADQVLMQDRLLARIRPLQRIGKLGFRSPQPHQQAPIELADDAVRDRGVGAPGVGVTVSCADQIARQVKAENLALAVEQHLVGVDPAVADQP